MWTQLHHRQRGQIIVIAPIALLAFIGMVGVIVDVGLFKLMQSEMQNAADAAALAAVWYDDACPVQDTLRCAKDNANVKATVAPGDTASKKVARNYVASNSELVTILCGAPPVVSPQSGVLKVPRVNAVSVVVSCRANFLGAQLFGLASVEIWAAGTAAIGSDDGTGNIMEATSAGGHFVGRLIPQS